MGFSALLPRPSGISCVGGAFAGAGEYWSSSESPLFGRPWSVVATRLNAGHFGRRLVVAVVRNELRGHEKREEERQKKQLLGVASVSIGFNTILLMSVTKPALLASPRQERLLGWFSLPLLAAWGAILLNAFVQYRILERLTSLPSRRESRVDVTLNQRLADVEEDVREFVTTARGLAKQVEKLGVRFRATKRTLRDPMQETAAIAQKTSEVATMLARREDRLEEELRGLQLNLLAMQDHQAKQLALISLALKRKPSPHPSNDAPATKTLRSAANGHGSPSLELSADAIASSAQDAADAAVTSSSNGKDAVGSPEASLSKVDFWQDTATHSGKTTTARNGDVEAQEELAAAEYVEQPDWESESWLR